MESKMTKSLVEPAETELPPVNRPALFVMLEKQLAEAK